jgi:hypothetical protein
MSAIGSYTYLPTKAQKVTFTIKRVIEYFGTKWRNYYNQIYRGDIIRAT